MTGYTFGVDLRAAIRAAALASSRRSACALAATTTRRSYGADPGATMPQAAIDHLAGADDRARSAGDAYQPPGACHHDCGDGRGGTAGTAYRMDGMRAASGAAIAVSHRRRRDQPHPPAIVTLAETDRDAAWQHSWERPFQGRQRLIRITGTV